MARILLVDDESFILEAIERRLRNSDHGLLLATSADDAMRILEMVGIDCIVTDENMPGMSGSEFLGIVRERFPKTLRFMLTGTKDVAVAARAVNDAAVCRFLTKPFGARELLSVIETALAQRDAEPGLAPSV